MDGGRVGALGASTALGMNECLPRCTPNCLPLTHPLATASLRTEDYAMPKPSGGQEARPWLVRYRGHRAVPFTRTGGGEGGALFVPTEGEAARLGADGRELPFVRFSLQGLSLE